MQRRSILLLGIFALMLGGIGPVQAASRTVWSGLVIANNVEQPAPIPPAIQSAVTSTGGGSSGVCL